MASKGQERLSKYKIKAFNYFWTSVFHYINMFEALYSLSVKNRKDGTFIRWIFKAYRYCNCKVWVWTMLLSFIKGYHIHTETSVRSPKYDLLNRPYLVKKPTRGSKNSNFEMTIGLFSIVYLSWEFRSKEQCIFSTLPTYYFTF